MIAYELVLTFWFTELESNQWWVKDSDLDATVEKRFQRIHQQAVNGELFDWRTTARGSLAEIIVLDQFSRNIHRGKPQSFGHDAQALVLAQVAVEKKFDQELSDTERSFLYMPYMHSESAVIHELSMPLFSALDNKNTLEFEKKHKEIIDRFGRYPHRNSILGRESSQEEMEFLQQPGSSF